jgi:hypothetical protein
MSFDFSTHDRKTSRLTRWPRPNELIDIPKKFAHDQGSIRSNATRPKSLKPEKSGFLLLKP